MKSKKKLLFGYFILIGITGIIGIIDKHGVSIGSIGYVPSWVFGFTYGAIYGAIFGGIFFTVYWWYVHHKTQNLILK